MSDTVTLLRAEYEALLERLEDAEDAAAVAIHNASVEARGADAMRADTLPVDMVERLMAGESPVRVWRERRGLTQLALAEGAGVSKTYLNEIEAAKKPGSLEATAKIARALKVSIEDLLPWNGMDDD